MREIVRIPTNEVTPTVSNVLEAQGIPQWRQSDDRTRRLAAEAISLYADTAQAVAVMEEISKAEFQNVFAGEGLNEEESPVGPTYRAADSLSLYAVTIGQTICDRIAQLFEKRDFALGAMLDAAASEGAELTARAAELVYRRHLKESTRLDSEGGILRFSPGYCGWHVSGQKKLFNALRPGDIGITLSDSFLMTPLKSISGVIISGRKEIFYFEDVFSFCRGCAEHLCRERIQSVMEQ